MEKNNTLHAKVIELQGEYGKTDLCPLPLVRLKELAEQLREYPAEERRTIASHIAVFAARIVRLEIPGKEETIGQLFALAATAMDDVDAAKKAFEQSGLDANQAKGAAEKIGGQSIQFDPTKTGQPVGAGGLLGVLRKR